MNISLRTRYLDKDYKFFFLLGLLIAKKANLKNINKDNIISNKLKYPKVKETLSIIENPYLANNIPDIEEVYNSSKFIKLYVKLLIWFQKHFYFGLYLCSKLRLGIFETTTEATQIFCKVNPTNQNKLCLPRSIFAMTTSKSFKKKGVLFIGVFHPSRHMHAWILENGHNTYRYDNIWINYKPIGVII